jgi:hypothetical protein
MKTMDPKGESHPETCPELVEGLSKDDCGTPLRQAQGAISLYASNFDLQNTR